MSLGTQLLYLSRDAVEAAGLPVTAVIEAVAVAFVAKAEGRASSAAKQGLQPGGGRLAQAMLAYADDPPFAAVKAIGLAADNAARGLPHLGALLVLMDGASGVPVAVMDATWITAQRTAAITAVAARHLARRDSARLGFIACGVQARAHLTALRSCFPIAELSCYGHRRSTAEGFAAAARAEGVAARAVDEPRAAVADHDIVVSCVPAVPGLQPFLDPDWLAPGAFASLVDLGRSWWPAGFPRIDRLVVDDRAQDLGRLAYPGPFDADLGELLTGARPGRQGAGERAMLLFQGVAVTDLAVAALLFRAASAQGLGQMLPL